MLAFVFLIFALIGQLAAPEPVRRQPLCAANGACVESFATRTMPITSEFIEVSAVSPESLYQMFSVTMLNTYTGQKNIVLANQHISNKVIAFESCGNVTVTNCTFYNSSIKFVGSQDIVVKNNNFSHTLLGHAVQFNRCNGGAILNNYFEEPLGASSASDIISIFKSNGTSVSPIVIRGNYLIGGGPMMTGGGIMMGDNGGSWQLAINNICVNPGQYGIAIAGGDSNAIVQNTIMGKKLAWSNVGIYVWGVPQRNSTVRDAIVRSNTVGWTNHLGRPNPYWQGSAATTKNITVIGNIFNAAYVVPKLPANVGAPH